MCLFFFFRFRVLPSWCAYLHFRGRESQKLSIAVACHVPLHCNTKHRVSWLLLYTRRGAGGTADITLCRARSRYYSAVIPYVQLVKIKDGAHLRRNAQRDEPGVKERANYICASALQAKHLSPTAEDNGAMLPNLLPGTLLGLRFA